MSTYQAKIGYTRTSTVDQNPDTQIAAMKVAGCGMVRTEQRGGAKLKGRYELNKFRDFIRPGETLVVSRIDRFVRSFSDLQTIVSHLKSKGSHLVATERPVDTSTATRKAFFDMRGVFRNSKPRCVVGARPRGLPPSAVASTEGGFPRSL